MRLLLVLAAAATLSADPPALSRLGAFDSSAPVSAVFSTPAASGSVVQAGLASATQPGEVSASSVSEPGARDLMGITAVFLAAILLRRRWRGSEMSRRGVW